MRRFIITLLKILISCLVAGIVLSLFGVSLDTVLRLIGQTPDSFAESTRRVLDWAIPKAMLGAIFVVPAWILIYLFLPFDED